MKYRWLHLSDLHSYCMKIRTKIMRDSLIDEIVELNNEEQFSFLIVTGDLSDKNKGYTEAIDFIQEIMTKINIQPNKVFIVPGNHDLDRNIPQDREKDVQKLWNVSLLDLIEDESINKLILAQNEYFEVYKKLLNRNYPIDKVHFVEALDDKVNIININTSWMCCDSKNEEGKLHVGLNKLYDCLKDIDKDKFNIAIGHHRLEDLQPQVRNSMKSLFKSKGIDLYLGGHCHQAIIKEDRIINTDFCFCRQARAEDASYPAGFIVSNIDTENNQSYFLFFSWNSNYIKWTYDYSVEEAKHGKYYLSSNKFNTLQLTNRDVIVDLKVMGIPLDYKRIKKKYKLENAEEYKYGHTNIRPKTDEEWNRYLDDLVELYKSIIKNPNNCNINIFPIAPIPLLVSLGYLIQNDNPNINIYQYIENDEEWVFDEKDDNIKVYETYKENSSEVLAVAVEISSIIKKEDIIDVLKDYDLLCIKVDNPRVSYLNYKADVLRVRNILKTKLDTIYYKYKEIHLFLAAPAGLCIEIGRIIRKNMYPDTYIYNYCKTNDGTTNYNKIYNLKLVGQK